MKGAAKIWAKANLKDTITEGNWKRLKQMLIERFEGSKAYLRNLEKLSKLKFETNEGSLLSFIEKYFSYYKQAYPKATDSDIILSLRINLPDMVQKALILDDTWTSLTDITQMYTLARRAGEKILVYEKQLLEEDGMKPQEIVKMMTDLRNVLKESQKEKEDDTKQVAALALARQDQQKFKRQDNNNYRRRYQPYQQRNGRYQKTFAQPTSNYNNNRYNRNNADLNLWPSNSLQNNEKRLEITNGNQENDAYKNYVAKFGEPPSPYHNFRGKHFNKHCPYLNLN